MWNRFKFSSISGVNISGDILIIAGFVLLLISMIDTRSNQNISLISVEISLGLGLISIGIAFFSIYLSLGSDEKMIAIKKYHFSEILKQVYDYVSWCEKNKNANITTYQEKNDILEWIIVAKKAEIFKKWFDENETTAFSVGFTILLKNWLLQWKKGMLTEMDRQHIYDIFEFCKSNNMLTEIDTIEVNGYLEELKKEK